MAVFISKSSKSPTLAELRKQLEEKPRSANRHHRLSAKLKDEGHTDEALRHALKAMDLGLEANAFNSWHVRNLARQLNDLGLSKLAEHFMSAALTAKADPTIFTLEMARALKVLRNKPLAKQWAEHGVKTTKDPLMKRRLTELHSSL